MSLEVAVLNAGCMFGEAGVLSGQTRGADVVCLNKVCGVIYVVIVSGIVCLLCLKVDVLRTMVITVLIILLCPVCCVQDLKRRLFPPNSTTAGVVFRIQF